MNPYALSGTAPSRRRVYLFHHLGSRAILIAPANARQGWARGSDSGPAAPLPGLEHCSTRAVLYGVGISRVVTSYGGSKSESDTSLDASLAVNFVVLPPLTISS